MTELRRTPLHRALHRPNLIMGGERELVLVTGLLTAGVSVTSLNLPAFAVCAGLWVVCLYFLRLMAKSDADMSKVYLRQLKYKGYYAPRSRHWRID